MIFKEPSNSAPVPFHAVEETEPKIQCMHAENLRVELWGPFLTVSGTRKGSAMGMRAPAKRSTAGGGKGVILRREMDYGFFSASWRLPVSPLKPHGDC